jgi:hypothetical protein
MLWVSLFFLGFHDGFQVTAREKSIEQRQILNGSRDAKLFSSAFSYPLDIYRTK